MKTKTILRWLIALGVLFAIAVMTVGCASHHPVCPTYSILYYNESKGTYFTQDTNETVSQGDCFIKVPPGDIVVVQEVIVN